VKVTLGCNLSLRQMDRCSVLATPRGGKPDTLYSGLSPREVTAVARVLARGEHPGEAAAPSSGAASAGAARGP
jgi:hypothetical protein